MLEVLRVFTAQITTSIEAQARHLTDTQAMTVVTTRADMLGKGAPEDSSPHLTRWRQALIADVSCFNLARRQGGSLFELDKPAFSRLGLHCTDTLTFAALGSA